MRPNCVGEVGEFGVVGGELLDDFPMRALLISPSIEDSEDISLEDAQEALAHCAGVVL